MVLTRHSGIFIFCLALSTTGASADSWRAGANGSSVAGAIYPTAASTKFAVGITSTPSYKVQFQAADYQVLKLSTAGTSECVTLSASPTGTGDFVLNTHGGNGGFVFGTGNPNPNRVGTMLMRILSDGKVGVGVEAPTEKLHVSGNIKATGYVTADGGIRVKGLEMGEIPDYVFDKAKYRPMSLDSVERFVEKNRHLPHIPSAKDMSRDGMDVADMNLRLLKTVEEMTLHLIEQRKALREQAERIKQLEARAR